MPTYVKGSFLDNRANRRDGWNTYVIFSANGVLLKDNAGNANKLVMGRGAAKALLNKASKDIASKLPSTLASIILNNTTSSSSLSSTSSNLIVADSKSECVIKYGLVISGLMVDSARVGAFQSKLHWRDASSLDLLQFSIHRLFSWSVVKEVSDLSTIHMNFPGVGLGKLNPVKVKAMLDRLPPKVYIYTL